jgi:putative membrane protein
MNLVTQIAAVFMGVTLVVVFVLESFFYRRPELHSIFLIEPGQEATVRLWVVNQGFYNLFFGAAALAGVALASFGRVDVGTALVVFTCASMAISGAVLFVTERRLWRSSIAQALPPSVALVALAVAG